MDTMAIFEPHVYNMVLAIMTGLAVVVFISLQFVEAGYGVAYTRKWGPTVNNCLGWVLMEAPVFVAMAALWYLSPRRGEIAPAVMASIFMLHYFQRSFVFPLLIRGKGKMPLSVILMGLVFNVINAYMLGGWLFYVSPENYYGGVEWLGSWQFIVGTALFAWGMFTNLQSDSIIRHLRKPGDTRHYIPRGGMFKYVASANYLGEFAEWCGYALLTWSWAGGVFALWTFANLAPRARKLHKRYEREFGDEYTSLHRRYIIPFIY